ncbi:MAG: DUF4876 domain-containing protein [Prevotella sp.]
MKKTIRHFWAAMAAIALTTASCTSFSDASDAEKVEALQVSVTMTINVENLKSVKDLKVKLDDYTDDYHYIKEVSEAGTVNIDDVIPGIYTISVSGNAFDKDDVEYYINGNVVNKALYKGVTSVSVDVQGLKVSPLVFKEIYFAGSKGWYFRDQFYEVYNNSSEVQYLDGVYFAQLYPTNATTKLPVWKYEEDGTNCYGERIWKFPGEGSEYPLQPGESAVISQFAANHQLEIYNPESPVDGSHSEFEFNMDNPNFPDQPAIDMVHVFYQGKAEKGSIPQFLTPVFGGAFALMRIPADSGWDPVNKEEWKNYDGNSTLPKAKIPNKYVLDAVECVNNESMSNAKRIPAVLDAGITWVGATYCGLGIARRVMVENGDTLRRENGAIIYQDTNNSTDDFERGVVPVMHRNGAGVPSWNVTYK